MDEESTYVDTDHTFRNTTVALWNHGLAQVITALLEAGLQLRPVRSIVEGVMERVPRTREQHPAAIRILGNRPHVVERMHQRDGVELRSRRLLAHQWLEAVGGQRALDRAQPVGPLRMAGRGEVLQAGGMADEERGHGGVKADSARTATDLAVRRAERKHLRGKAYAANGKIRPFFAANPK